VKTASIILGTALTVAVPLGATACSVTFGSPATPPKSGTPSPSVKTVIETVTPSATRAPASPMPATQARVPSAPPPTPVETVPNVTDPWAVVSAYYGDVESGNYAQAYALLSSGMVTGQSLQQFTDGYACTGSETLSENWESGDQVNFNLQAYDTCKQVTDYYTGTDTVQGGRIVAADVYQTG